MRRCAWTLLAAAPLVAAAPAVMMRGVQRMEPGEVAPSGTYVGSTNVAGLEIRGTVSFKGQEMDFTVSGPLTVISCVGEAFTYRATESQVTFDHITQDGNSVRRALREMKASLKGIWYDPEQDAVTVKGKVMGLKGTMHLDKRDLKRRTPTPAMAMARPGWLRRPWRRPKRERRG